MTIDITAETERIVQEELRSGHFRSVDDLIVTSVRAWHKSHVARPAAVTTNGKEKAREFVAWAESHEVTAPLSDEAISRASLNPDRW